MNRSSLKRNNRLKFKTSKKKITERFRGNWRIFLNSMKEKLSTGSVYKLETIYEMSTDYAQRCSPDTARNDSSLTRCKILAHKFNELMIDYACQGMDTHTHKWREKNWSETLKNGCLRHAQDFDSLQDHTQNSRKMMIPIRIYRRFIAASTHVSQIID